MRRFQYSSKWSWSEGAKPLGKELVKDGVMVRDRTRSDRGAFFFAQSTPAYLAYTRSKIPMDRFGTVEQAWALIWLASRECSFSTGAVFDLSGGRATY